MGFCEEHRPELNSDLSPESMVLKTRGSVALLVVPQPTEWKDVGNEIEAAMIFAGADFIRCLTASVANVNHVVVRVRVVVAVAALVASAGYQGYPQHVPLFSRDRQGTSVPSSTRVPRWQLLKVCASLGQFNYRRR